jgi:prepilin-type N-terminal cleavage/methylation domain-containing protein
MRMRPKSRGFTLIELLVTIGIFVFMTYLILARYNSFSSGTLLTNLAYDVALSIRTAQTYGVSVLAAEKAAVGVSKFDVAYGVDFDRTGNVDTRSFNLFADLDDDHYFDSGEEVSKYNIKQGAKITNLCAGTILDCKKVDHLSITFKRPEPNARIYGDATKAAYAEITVSSGDESSTRVIKVNEFGLISVGN